MSLSALLYWVLISSASGLLCPVGEGRNGGGDPGELQKTVPSPVGADPAQLGTSSKVCGQSRWVRTQLAIEEVSQPLCTGPGEVVTVTARRRGPDSGSSENSAALGC